MQTIVNGRLLNYLEVNPKSNKPFIILHGWGHTAAMWLEFSKLLDPRFHYYLIDLPAFGGSTYLLGNPDIPHYSEVILSFINKLKLKHPLILGHSFGGQITLDLAINHPQLLEDIFLLSPAGIRKRSLRTNVKIFLARHFTRLLLLLPISIRRFISSRFGSSDYANSNPHQRTVLKNIIQYDLSSKLHLIEDPVHLLWGSEDHAIPYTGKFMAESIPNSTLDIIYGQGHNPYITKPDLLAKVINRYLKSVK